MEEQVNKEQNIEQNFTKENKDKEEDKSILSTEDDTVDEECVEEKSVILTFFKNNWKKIIGWIFKLFIIYVIAWQIYIGNVFYPMRDESIKYHYNETSYYAQFKYPKFLKLDARLHIGTTDRLDIDDAHYSMDIKYSINSVKRIDFYASADSSSKVVKLAHIQLDKDLKPVKKSDQELYKEYEPQIKELCKETEKAFGLKLKVK